MPAEIRFLPVAGVMLLLGACSGEKALPVLPTTPDKPFEALAQRYVDEHTRYSPINATQLGDHRWDAEIDDWSEAGRRDALAFNAAILGELEAIDRSALSRANQVDWLLLQHQLRSEIWARTELREWQWNPVAYTQLVGGALYNLMAREYAPIESRLRSATARLEKLPDLLAQQRANLDPARVPAIHAETAVKQNRGVLAIVQEFIEPNLLKLDAAQQAQLKAAIEKTRAAIELHQAWLEKDLLPKAKGDFRLGAPLYDQKLKFALYSDLTREQIRGRAETELRRVRAEMYQIARGVLAGQKKAPPTPEQPSAAQAQTAIAAALELAYADKPGREQVVDTAKHSLAETTEFVKKADLVSVPSDPVEIILMPEFQRGVAVAYCDSPGPLDVGQKTFYAVSPIPQDWTPPQVESFLREYNTRSIHELTIHEAMPGHFLQIAYSNRYPSTLRAVLQSNTFIEGWAVYAERLMADAGYMNGDPLMKLIQRKWYLRAVANAILDQAIHVDGMTREQAMELMTVQTFQQEREAAGKWVRAQLTSAQLPVYFVGSQEYFDLRRETEQREGERFALKAYHDRVLSYGSPPVRFVRELMADLPVQ